MSGWDEHPRAGYPNGDPYEMPADLAAVQADDALLDMIGAGHAPSDADDELTRVLTAWRHEVHAEPVRELVDTSTALALIRAAARRPVRRQSPVFGSIAGAAAVLVIAFSSVGMVAKSAEPGDGLWSVTQVLYRDYARSVETAAAVRTELNEATTALKTGNPERARAALQHVQQQLPVIGEAEGRTDLTARHRQLEQKLNGPPDTGKGNFPGGPVFTRPVPAGPGVDKPRDSSAPSSEESATTPGSAGQLPDSSPTTDSHQYLPGRDFPRGPYPYPGAGNPGSGAQDRDAPDRDAPDRDAPDRDAPGDGSSAGEAVPGAGANNGGSRSGTSTPGGSTSGGSTTGSAPSPSPSPNSGPAGRPGSGQVSGSRPPSSGFPGCDRPPPRPRYCG